MGFSVKMLFHPDTNEKAIEICFFNRRKNYQPLIFNSTNAELAASQKYLGLILDSKLDFSDHIDNKININVIRSST